MHPVTFGIAYLLNGLPAGLVMYRSRPQGQPAARIALMVAFAMLLWWLVWLLVGGTALYFWWPLARKRWAGPPNSRGWWPCGQPHARHGRAGAWLCWMAASLRPGRKETREDAQAPTARSVEPDRPWGR